MSDVFGVSLHDYWSGDTETLVTIRRDDGFTDTHSPGIWLSDRPWPSEAPLIARARGAVLDVGCGGGRHLLPLQREGFEITGLDLSPLAVDICRERGCKNVILGDVADVPLEPDSFDTILLFGNNIGIGGTPAGVTAMMRRLRSVARPGGQLLIASLDASQTENPLHRAYHDECRRRGDPIGQIKIRLEYKSDISAWFDWFHPQPDELREYAAESGWAVRKISMLDRGHYAAELKVNDEW